MLGGSRSLHVVVRAVASSLAAVAVARRSRRRCLRRTRSRCMRRRAGAPGAGFIVQPRSRRRDARLPHAVAAACFLGAMRSARRLLLSACGHWRGRFLCGGGRRRTTLTPPLLPLTLSRCLRRRTGALGAGLPVRLRSWRRDARPPLFPGSGSLSQRSAKCSAACALCVWTLARSLPLWRRSRSHGAHDAAVCGAHAAAACGAALALLAPASSRRRARGTVTLGRCYSWQRLAFSARCIVLGGLCSLYVDVGAVASSLEAVAVARRSRRRCLRCSRRCYLRRRTGTPGAGMLVPPRSQRRGARPMLLVAAARFLSTVRITRWLELSACGPWRDRFLSGGGRCRPALSAPLPAVLTALLPSAPHWSSWRRHARDAMLAAACCSAHATYGSGSPSQCGAKCLTVHALCVWPLA